MTRDEYIQALLPGARQSIIHFVGQEKERRARAMLDQYSTSELSLMYAKHVGSGTIKPSSPATLVTDQEVEAERIKGEQELQKLRDEFVMDQAMAQEARIMDAEKFRKQQFDQQAPQRAAQLAKDKETFLDAYNRLRSFKNDAANWNLASSTLGPGFTVYALEQALESNAIQLSKPSQDEIDEWASQDVEAHNARLRGMDPMELRAEMKRQQIANRAASSQREENQMLEEMRLRDLQLNLPPLPTHINAQEVNAKFLKTLCNTDLGRYKQMLRRFGGYQLTLRLQGRA